MGGGGLQVTDPTVKTFKFCLKSPHLIKGQPVPRLCNRNDGRFDLARHRAPSSGHFTSTQVQ